MALLEPLTTTDPLMSLAHDILLRGPREAVGPMRAEEVKEWRDAARWYVDTDGDDPDLQFLCERADSWEAYGEYAYAAEVRTGREEYAAHCRDVRMGLWA